MAQLRFALARFQRNSSAKIVAWPNKILWNHSINLPLTQIIGPIKPMKGPIQMTTEKTTQ